MGDITKQEEMGQLLEAILNSDGWLKLGKNLGDPYSLSFNDRGHDSSCNRCDYNRVRAYVLSNITDQKLIGFCNANAQLAHQSSICQLQGKVLQLPPRQAIGRRRVEFGESCFG